MPLDDPTLSDEARISRLEAEVLRLEDCLRRAGARHAQQRAEFEEYWKESLYPSDEEMGLIQGIGGAKDELQLAREALICLRNGKRPPSRSIDISDGIMPLDFQCELAKRSRARAGLLDYIDAPAPSDS